jgi:glycerol-3-phosphate dehydrogenase (NAD(P)+)
LNVAVLGAGAWGTAIAAALSVRHSVMLYRGARSRDNASVSRATAINAKYLPALSHAGHVTLQLRLTKSSGTVEWQRPGLTLIATPTDALRSCCA